MVTQVILCPFCRQVEPFVQRHEPNPRKTCEATKQGLERALVERISKMAHSVKTAVMPKIR